MDLFLIITVSIYLCYNIKEFLTNNIKQTEILDNIIVLQILIRLSFKQYYSFIRISNITVLNIRINEIDIDKYRNKEIE